MGGLPQCNFPRMRQLDVDEVRGPLPRSLEVLQATGLGGSITAALHSCRQLRTLSFEWCHGDFRLPLGIQALSVTLERLPPVAVLSLRSCSMLQRLHLEEEVPMQEQLATFLTPDTTPHLQSLQLTCHCSLSLRACCDIVRAFSGRSHRDRLIVDVKAAEHFCSEVFSDYAAGGRLFINRLVVKGEARPEALHPFWQQHDIVSIELPLHGDHLPSLSLFSGMNVCVTRISGCRAVLVMHASQLQGVLHCRVDHPVIVQDDSSVHASGMQFLCGLNDPCGLNIPDWLLPMGKIWPE